MIVLALGLYCLRLLGFSFINSPMESLFFEVSTIFKEACKGRDFEPHQGLSDIAFLMNMPFTGLETVWELPLNDRRNDLRQE